MTKSFSAQVDAWVRKSKKLQEAVFKESVQRTIDIAQVPVGKGGRMRVDTGFLRNSGVTTLNAPVSTVTFNPDKQSGYAHDVSAVIAGATVQDSIFHTWTADYAVFRENKDGFRLGAMQEWQNTVNQVVRELKNRIR